MKDIGIAMKIYRLEKVLYKYHFTFMAKIVYRMMQIVLGCTIPYTVDIETGVEIALFTVL